MFKKKEERVEEEILDLVEEGHEQGFIEEEEAEMISNILDLDDKIVRDIMTSRSKIYAVSKESVIKDIISECIESGFSRYPVYDEDIDNIIGVLHLKDMTREYLDNPESSAEDVMEEAIYIHPTYDITKLLKKMQKEKNHMAIVLDEYGQTDGLVTLEDILEEIVGNIYDEHDEETEEVSATYGDGYQVDGMIKLHDLEELIETLEFPDTDIETLNGFLLYKLGRFPKLNENIKIDYGGYSFEPTEIEDRLIKSVRITRIKND
ncbi:MAG: HlyC/CorC family transporter [Eubacterium sp.]|nr:HlyC/CorC family transporter [Eubacterium sp.]